MKIEPKKELIKEFPAVSFYRTNVGDIDGLKDVVWSLNSQPYLSWPFWLIKQKDQEDFYVAESCAVMLRIRNHLKQICE